MNKVLVLGGSIRAKAKNRKLILDASSGISDIADFQRNIREVLRTETLCNSEIIAGAAIAGARRSGAEVDYFPLRHLFPRMDSPLFVAGEGNESSLANVDTLDIDQDSLDELLKALDESTGIVLATPVYFGDRSSVANKFLQLAAVRERVRDKVYGVVSVGAKRNGGQETCDIFSLYEMLHLGTFGVGNGVPTSQYGGTAVGGDYGKVADDEWGLSTALGTGEHVGQVARLITAGQQSDPVRAKIVFLQAMDTRDGKLRRHVDGLLEKACSQFPDMEFSSIHLVDHNIYRCLGCKLCPKDGNTSCDHPQCIIQNPDDYLETARRELADADGVIVCGINPASIDDLVTRYQVFTERMRSIRRNNYELSNVLFAGMCYHEFGATINPIHSLKVMVSYIRHNTIMHRPIEIFEHNGTAIETGETQLGRFCRAVSLLTAGKNTEKLPSASYNPFGEGSGYSPESAD